MIVCSALFSLWSSALDGIYLIVIIRWYLLFRRCKL